MKQRSRKAEKQKAKKQKSRKAKKHKSRKAEKQKTRKAEKQKSRKAKEQRSRAKQGTRNHKKNQYGKQNPQKSNPPLEKKTSRQPISLKPFQTSWGGAHALYKISFDQRE